MDEAAGVGPRIRSRDYVNSVHVNMLTVTGTPADEKGKEVEASYRKPDHVLVGNGTSPS